MTRRNIRKGSLWGVFTLLGFAILALAVPIQAEKGPTAMESPSWLRNLPSGTCPGGDINCQRSSPALVDVDDDGILDIVLATRGGHIMAIKDDGTEDGAIIFNIDIGSAVASGLNNAVIQSSPAIGDIDGNDGGMPEIVVGFGSDVGTGTKGGIIVLEHNGTVKVGWPKFSQTTHANGNPMTVFSSPAIGDLDNDGDMEIVTGSFGKRIYAYHHNGTLVSGFPADSALRDRFPTWPNLVGKLADSIWGSPALADIDDDGYLDIVIGTDEGNFDQRYGGDSGGWNCPYQLPPGWAPGYCGGTLYALDRHGNSLPGFPKRFLEIIQSTPAIADIDDDGTLDILFGTGTFYRNNSPDHPTFGFKMYSFSGDGSATAGWSGGKSTSNTTPASPAIGDIAGDSAPEIIIGDNSGRLYAWYADGSLVPGFPMTPRTFNGQTHIFDVGNSFVLGDIDNDNKQEIIFNYKNSIVMVDGNGTQLTTQNGGTDGKPGYTTGGYLVNTPAIGDIDNDGELELIAHDSRLFVWDLPNSNLDSDWPMFKSTATRHGRLSTAGILGPVQNTVSIIPPTGYTHTTGYVKVPNIGDEPLNFNANDNHSNVVLPDNSGQINGQSNLLLPIDVNNLNSFGPGWHNLGEVNIATTDLLGDPAGTAQVTLELFIGNSTQIYLPLINRP